MYRRDHCNLIVITFKFIEIPYLNRETKYKKKLNINLSIYLLGAIPKYFCNCLIFKHKCDCNTMQFHDVNVFYS